MNYPSVKAIATKLSVDNDTAKKIRGFLDGSLDPYDLPSVSEYARKCYHQPPSYMVKLQAIDELLETCGVESIHRDELPSIRGMKQSISYCNTGDGYSATVLCFAGEKRFRIGNWADLCE